MSVAAAQYAKFREQAARAGRVFTFTNEGEYLVYQINGKEVLPFWSSRRRLVLIQNRVPKYRRFDVSEMAMAEESGESLGLLQTGDQVTETGRLHLGAVSYRDQEGYFMRIWHVSDGKNFAKITYTCLWDQRFAQLQECEAIVRSVQFV